MYRNLYRQLSRKCEVENKSLPPIEFAGHVRGSGTREHRESLPRKLVTREMDAAIKRLIVGRITRGALLQLFDQRATFAAINAWRYGWRGAPQWAVDLIQGKLAAQAAADLAASASLRIGKGQSGGGAIGAKALRAWRERKARERDEKEKAACEQAALNREQGTGG